MAGLVVVSVIGRRFFNSPVNGDFELVSMGAAIAVFTFLPYTQARRGNILVDTFTSWLPARTNQLIDAFWDLVYAGTMGFLAVCLIDGTLRALPQRPDHHAAAARRLAGHCHLRRADGPAHLRRAGDGGRGSCGGSA